MVWFLLVGWLVDLLSSSKPEILYITKAGLELTTILWLSLQELRLYMWAATLSSLFTVKQMHNCDDKLKIHDKCLYFHPPLAFIIQAHTKTYACVGFVRTGQNTFSARLTKVQSALPQAEKIAGRISGCQQLITWMRATLELPQVGSNYTVSTCR